MIHELEQQPELKDIALLDQIEAVARPILVRLAGL